MNFMFPFLVSLFAGLSTGLGSSIVFFIEEIKTKHLSVLLGFSAGVIIYLSFVKLLLLSIDAIGFLFANLMFFTGVIVMACVDFLVPHEYATERLSETNAKKVNNLIGTGIIVALGLAIHNFPEGIATFFGTVKDVELGILLMVAIAIHNIPEGISISVPIFYATGNRKKAFLISLCSGLAEPAGALLGFAAYQQLCQPFTLNCVLGLVGGVMIFISFDELLPTSLNHGKNHLSIASVFIGMATMLTTMILL